MLSQIAQVFSSQGVVLPGTELVPVRARPAAAPGDPASFKAAFDQASAKLDISRQGKKLAAGRKDAGGKDLGDDEKKTVEALKKRDMEVRRHEQQHIASGGGFTGGANFEYEQGPDGKAYAVGGHVSIDASPVSGNPQATLAKAQIVQRAALAPADPSGQDRAVAAAAAQMAIEARKQIDEKTRGGGSEAPQGNAEDTPSAEAASASPAALRGYARGGANPPQVRFSAHA
jgi:hypothetical protein